MTFGLQVSDDRLEGRTAPQLSFDDTEDTVFLAGDEDATGILRVVAVVSLGKRQAGTLGSTLD